MTSRFKKDYKKMSTRNNFDEKSFKKVVGMLADNIVLPEKYCNHLLEPKSNRIMGMSYKTRLASDIYKKRRETCFGINTYMNTFRFI